MKKLFLIVLVVSVAAGAVLERRAIGIRDSSSPLQAGASWQDTCDPASLTLSAVAVTANGNAAKIVANSSGTVTKLRWHFAERLSGNIKLAIYSDASGPDVPLGSGAGASPVNDGSAGYIEVVGLSVPVTSGVTYWIAHANQTATQVYSYETTGGERHYHLGSEDYSLFPENPYGSNGSDAVKFAAGMFK